MGSDPPSTDDGLHALSRLRHRFAQITCTHRRGGCYSETSGRVAIAGTFALDDSIHLCVHGDTLAVYG